METQYKKIKKYLSIIESTIYCNYAPISDIQYCNCGYKSDNTFPSLDSLKPYQPGSFWGNGNDSHAWFYFTVNVPENMKSKPLQLRVRTDRSGWDADNPQFICYVDGVLRQGMDTNHTYIALDGKDAYDVYLYGYTGPKIPQAKLFAEIRNVNIPAFDLYFDIRVPFEMLDYLDVHSQEYAEIVRMLDQTVSMLDLFEIGSHDYFASVEAAREYIRKVFYEDYCCKQSATTVCIGHTHIDCAWKWTLKQTREKVQRSFATVLELMSRYPDYKFMSSQALLYQNLKEEAPELYEKVKEMIKSGRWECEGAMWVEADCNLSSGESLVRQIMYGKNFFKNEFGVDNKVLWLPDVFGYSAAMPQILKKCGVDWFVTSKISWNDTNLMPYDTFAWQGIDGTKINTFFLTPQDRKRSAPERYTTYVGNTGSRMIAGTYYRYQQKNLNNEALLTFGYGDGGGGPTVEHLEMQKRTEKGIPGAPNSKIEFASDFLTRLEKKIEGNPLLPQWRGELYLEFHRGTYTSIAKNKRNNRQSEFSYLDAELWATVAKQLFGDAFPKKELHKGWEMILTNQFHDIIPGSSIKEVYDQCDIDYAYIKSVSDKIISGVQSKIAASVSKDKGYIVFNPHSFEGRGLVRIDGKSALVSGIAPKGYTAVSSFKTDCDVKIDGNTVETPYLKVVFDENWLISSIYDKKACREVLKAGAKGNEIRVYADHPDRYDAWEWQAYSNDGYRVLTAFDSATIIDDGARMGIRIVRPHMNSKITQTVWFSDENTKIDFETVADWHQKHQMVKAAFDVDINADKATYEIQFGTIERPTHCNTSWDKAKFEVCGHKYADISEGGYGVSLLNDCKYGHDIHGSVMQLSLFKSPTDPNPEADQGEIFFTYSLYPHANKLCDSDAPRLAYYLNYPMTAIKACGETDILPSSFSALTVNCDNVICETVKEAEESEDNIIRLYECKNIRTNAELSVGLDAKKCYLCDMMENNIEELPITNGKVSVRLGGFEVATLKLIK